MVYVCDDASTDQTRETVERQFGSRVVFLGSEKNWGGPAWGRNRAISCSSSEYVAFCDSDDVWQQGKIVAQFELMRRLGTAASCTQAVCIAEDGATEVFNIGNGERDSLVTHQRLRRMNHVVASSALVNRLLLSTVGGFPERRSAVAIEDYLCWGKVSLYTDFALVGTPYVTYRKSPASLSAKSRYSPKQISREFRRETRRHRLRTLSSRFR